ncbi:hypothetical protein MTR67_035966 [Solanum verrucosum]|uniref:Reverse transcriptase/retrotransposon-derived protein RNase H-like domain-containing protein n=1 Tax=Solanum verrucosum TaxID=315347 RepID=A0AAF0UBN0_SOLVR|nr:hypothetical protein MTR67_035966 [Solanum verrucosum]
MTWLSPYYDVLNCNAKLVTLEIPGRERLEWEGVYKPKPAKSPFIESIAIVSEVKEVFFTDSPGLRELKAQIQELLDKGSSVLVLCRGLLMAKEVPFEWTEKCDESFQELKTLLITTPILALSVEGKDFIVYCDASHPNLGDVLMQDKNVIAYASRQLKDADVDSLSTESILVVSKFKEAFRTDLYGMPPDRDIDFCIDLQPDTLPISIPPYRMTPTGLRELKSSYPRAS